MAGDAAAVRSSAVGAWIPADDVLLKNAVEAGASLESLAKGAVHFSRRFTVQELQDRWYSILYDPVVAEEASARMTEFECSAPNSTSKFSRLGSSKENKCVPGKRKAESVRSSYYALRKRICSEPFDPMDLNFILAPSDSNYIVNGDEPLSQHVMTGDPIPNHFGVEGSDMDNTMHHMFPQNLMHDSTAIGGIVTVDTFQIGGFQKPAEEDFLVEQDNLREESPYIEDNLPITGNESEVKEFGQPKELPDCSMFSAGDLGMEPPCSLDQINNDEVNMCSPFEGNQVFNVSASDSSASFHDLEYSTQLPGTHIWSTIPATTTPVDVGIRENDTCTRDSFELLDDIGANNTTISGYDIDLRTEMAVSDFKSPASTEVYLAELSNSLLNFTSEEELMFKDEIDKSYYDGLSSLLMSSPKDDVEEHMINLIEPETLMAPVMYPMNPSGTDPAVADDIRVSLPGDDMNCHPETLMQSFPTALNSQFPEYKDGVICCTLNTEEWEIPCNDDVFLLNHMPLSSTSCKVKEASKPKSKCSSVKDLAVNQRNGDMGPCFMQKEQRNPGKSLGSQSKGSRCIPEVSSKSPLCNFELSKTDPVDVASTSTCHVSGNRGQIDSAKAITNPLPGILKEDTRDGTLTMCLGYASTESHMANSCVDYDCVRSYPQPYATETNWESDASATIRDHQSLHAEVVPMDNAVSEPEVNPVTSDFEGLFDSDDDIPCYSDIEAMILDMDLDPDDQEMYHGEEVSRYQDDNTRRAIMRLEQGAYSYMQRAIASHGAFAILYGRHSKHYIKKPEVLLGRTTKDVIVDIDLAREGRGNKVSRQQAVLKMEKDGSFHLKNLGSCSISVNSTELTPGQSLCLSSSCLIEIRGMPFIFEMNQTRVKQYLDSITQG
ncbi:putative transcription factor interactor and regulator FHA-SMAD family [Rosa chinensis]|uniref:Putative transcription factor interactor and regulator FHA-SMAD family n=1 Tax=Rosa chinensis TaxID=74649 RepID=A0A2P6PYY9_ROSCH|nr:uncharacterized protein LOC112172247 [Rosa chinensis]PRQ27134.1 putative transcription factor interactor and regulator FHA-SMAD family [Rosa chinensis]